MSTAISKQQLAKPTTLITFHCTQCEEVRQSCYPDWHGLDHDDCSGGMGTWFSEPVSEEAPTDRIAALETQVADLTSLLEEVDLYFTYGENYGIKLLYATPGSDDREKTIKQIRALLAAKAVTG